MKAVEEVSCWKMLYSFTFVTDRGRRREPVAVLPGQPRVGGPSLDSAEYSICANLDLVLRDSPQGTKLVVQ